MLGKIGPPAVKALPALKKMLEDKPREDRDPPKPGGPSGDAIPRVRKMTEAEFYPQIERAVSAAIDQISGAKEDRK
jgi:hypothetical protein